LISKGVNSLERGELSMKLSSADESARSSIDTLASNGDHHAPETRSMKTGEIDDKPEDHVSVVIIDSRALHRECLAQSLRSRYFGASVSAFATVDELRHAKKNRQGMSVILLSIGRLKIIDGRVADDIKQIKSEFASVPFIIVADNEELAQIMNALENGACGYIPTTVSIDVAVGAIELALAGGVFVPASSVLSMRDLIASNGHGPGQMPSIFTARQNDVAEALRHGKANKVIAYELNMCESTVKVHIRNIMRKLNATNRTEAVYKMDTLFARETRMPT
jgi:DNA-binding NarL/FixJ family response regulator